MKRYKNKTGILFLLSVATLIAVVFVGYAYLKKENNKAGIIRATITKITQRPNIAENAYYGIDVQASTGNGYTINATGYLNSPASPDYFGETCVDVPSLKVGDKIDFNLPKSSYDQHIFGICYKKGEGDYFIKQR